MKKTILITGVIVVGVAVAALAIYMLKDSARVDRILGIVNYSTPTHLFLPLLVIVPVLGVPLSVFLVILGLKFGLVNGLLLIIVVIPFHLMLSHVISISMKSLILSRLPIKDDRIPKVKDNNQMNFALLVFLVPGIPYAIRNYTIAISGMPFKTYFLYGWICHSVMAAPIVLVGRSAAEMSLELFLFSGGFFLALYLFQNTVIPAIQKRKDK